MAFNFPASPSEDQIFSPAGGPVYKAKSGIWMLSELQPCIMLTNRVIAEDAAISTVVGYLSTGRTTGTPVYTLVSNPEFKFAISGNELRIGGALDYEMKTWHRIIIGVSGVTPAVANRVFIIAVTDISDAIPASYNFSLADNSMYLGNPA